VRSTSFAPAGFLINMIEQSKAIVDGAITRDESRGAHFKMDTPERSDTDWLKTTLASYDNGKTKFEFEPIDCRFIAPRARKYAVNQIGIVKKIMGENFLEGFAGAAK
jgi:succinate dehydrogenase / fumarate reductase flavoprotein subunit